MSPAQDGRGPLPHTSTWRGLLVTTRTRLLRRNRRDSVNAGRLTPATATSSDVHGSGCGCDSIYGGKLFTSDWLGRDSMPPAAPAVLTRRVGGVTGFRGSPRCAAFAASNTHEQLRQTERYTQRDTQTHAHGHRRGPGARGAVDMHRHSAHACASTPSIIHITCAVCFAKCLVLSGLVRE